MGQARSEGRSLRSGAKVARAMAAGCLCCVLTQERGTPREVAKGCGLEHAGTWYGVGIP